jgi:hypothetical protein
MSSVTYFPRYSNQENAVTNTTLHLFSQINRHSTEKFQMLLCALIGDVEIPLGINFEQQTRSTVSVPDAVIQQFPVHVVIETKVTAGVDIGQLLRHCETFTPGVTGNFLMLLTKADVSEQNHELVREKAAQYSARFCAVTFERLCQALKTVAEPHEVHLRHIVDDFLRYADELQLLPDRRTWLSIVPCGDTIDLNALWHMYYKPASRGYEPTDFLGIYNQKAVRYIGRIVSVYDYLVGIDGTERFELVRGTPRNDFIPRIHSMIKGTEEEVGWRIGNGMRFFCAEQLISTEFKKTSPHGIQGGRYWDISAAVSEGQSDVELAAVLREQTWS